jgi:hypothetical protein
MKYLVLALLFLASPAYPETLIIRATGSGGDPAAMSLEWQSGGGMVSGYVVHWMQQGTEIGSLDVGGVTTVTLAELGIDVEHVWGFFVTAYNEWGASGPSEDIVNIGNQRVIWRKE